MWLRGLQYERFEVGRELRILPVVTFHLKQPKTSVMKSA